MTHAVEFLAAAEQASRELDTAKIERLARCLAELRELGGRLFILGVGGSAANAGHAVNDFRKLCGIQAYAPTDNVAELTARTNDDGWETVFSAWLEVSRIGGRDALLILSVGGGSADGKVSACLVEAMVTAEKRGAQVFGIVGRSDGYTAKRGHTVIVVPEIKPEWVTPLSEAFQAVIWHCLVCHPLLRQ